MSKSLGNLFTVQDVVERGIDPLALRFLFLTAHYRSEMNFTWEALEGAEKGLRRLRGVISNFEILISKQIPNIKSQVSNDYISRFEEMVGEDLGTAGVVALVWEVVRDGELGDEEKLELVLKMDEVLGLGLSEVREVQEVREVPEGVRVLLDKRGVLRGEGKYEEADEVRREIEEMGYVVEDREGGRQVALWQGNEVTR